jgi:hypothetical protein
VGAAQSLEDLLHAVPRDGERHLVVLGLAEDAVAGAGEDDLRLPRLHGGDDDVGADGAALEGGGEAPAPLPQRGLGESHHLGGVGVDADEVRLEDGAVERRHEKRLVLPGRELVDGRLGARARRLGLRVHALAERAHVVDRQGLVESDGGDAQRADVILAGQRDHPAVAPCHVDDLAGHAELLEVAGRPPRPLGDGLAGLEHPDRDREGLRTEIRLQLPIRRLRIDHEWSSLPPEGTGVPHLCQAGAEVLVRMGGMIRGTSVA